MSSPPFTMSKYATELDLLRDKCAWQEKRIAQLEEEIARGREFDRVANPTNERTAMDTVAAPPVVADHIAIVVNNNQPGWTNIVETAPNVTLDVGTKLYLAPAAKSRFPDIDIDEGEVYAGLVRNPDTGAWHHLVLLPATTDEDLTWKEANDWAMIVAGGNLPTRDESALLYANLRDKIDQNHWYWTATEVASEPSWAWGQDFGDGYQFYGHKDDLTRARAVRRVPV